MPSRVEDKKGNGSEERSNVDSELGKSADEKNEDGKRCSQQKPSLRAAWILFFKLNIHIICFICLFI